MTTKRTVTSRASRRTRLFGENANYLWELPIVCDGGGPSTLSSSRRRYIPWTLGLLNSVGPKNAQILLGIDGISPIKTSLLRMLNCNKIIQLRNGSVLRISMYTRSLVYYFDSVLLSNYLDCFVKMCSNSEKGLWPWLWLLVLADQSPPFLLCSSWVQNNQSDNMHRWRVSKHA